MYGGTRGNVEYNESDISINEKGEKFKSGLLFPGGQGKDDLPP